MVTRDFSNQKWRGRTENQGNVNEKSCSQSAKIGRGGGQLHQRVENTRTQINEKRRGEALRQCISGETTPEVKEGRAKYPCD